MPSISQNRPETPAFVPPEPYKKDPLFDPSQLPRGLRIVVAITLIVIGLLVIWLSAHK
jgi:hypothetical protein